MTSQRLHLLTIALGVRLQYMNWEGGAGAGGTNIPSIATTHTDLKQSLPVSSRTQPCLGFLLTLLYLLVP